MSQLKVPVVAHNVEVTLNIGLGKALAWGGYKSTEHFVPSSTLVDQLNLPHRVYRVIDMLKPFVVGAYETHDQLYPRAPIEWEVPKGSITYRVISTDDQEPTLAVRFKAVSREIIGQVFQLAEQLKQDCIAVWVHNNVNGGRGQLIGRYNYVWGEFKNEYFIHV
jgi:hypothetical protein